MSSNELSEDEPRRVKELATPEFVALFKDPNATSDQLEDAIKNIGVSSDELLNIARTLFPVEPKKAPRPAKDTDVYILERGDATMTQYNKAVDLVVKEHKKGEGVVVMHFYQYFPGMVFSCPKDMMIIPTEEAEFKDLLFEKQTEKEPDEEDKDEDEEYEDKGEDKSGHDEEELDASTGARFD